jgi:hypothetical protein
VAGKSEAFSREENQVLRASMRKYRADRKLTQKQIGDILKIEQQNLGLTIHVHVYMIWPMPNDDLTHDLEDLNLAATRVQQRLAGMRAEVAALVGADLRSLLVEHAELDDLKSEWIANHPPGSAARSTADADAEWSAICARAWDHDRALITFARSVRDAGLDVQMPLPTPAPARVNGGTYPESRL